MMKWELFHSGFLPPAWAYAIGLALAAAVLFLLGRELRGKRQRLRGLLIITRVGMVALMVLLLAQPNLLLTRRQEHRGQTLALVDDSASMFASDPVTEPRRLLDLARVLGLPELVGRPVDFQQAADRLREEQATISALRTAAAESVAALRMGLPWSDASQEVVTRAGPSLRALKSMLDGLRSREGVSAGERRSIDAAASALGSADAKGSLLALAVRPLQQADWALVDRQVGDCATALDDLRERLLARQAEADRAFLAANGRQDTLNGVFKNLTRYALARRAVAALPALAHAELMNLSRGSTAALDSSDAAGQTDLIEPLAGALASRPLDLINAVCVLTDGAQNRSYDLNRLAAFRKRGVPLIVVGVGSERAEEALAIMDVDGPLLATLRAPVDLGLELRMNLPSGTRIDLRYSTEGGNALEARRTENTDLVRRGAGTTVVGHTLPFSETLVAGGSGRAQHRVLLRLAKAGFQKIKIEVQTQEPAVKVNRELPLYVSPERPSMLVVADRPDLFTEALLAQRRYGIGVYPVFTYGREANAKRGEGRQALPKMAKDWSRYDLVVLCGKPFPGFTRDDAAALAGAVQEQGVSLLVLAGGNEGYREILAGPLGWPAAPAAPPLATPDAILPQDEMMHLPLVQISADVIRNRNLWQDFAAPSTWRAAPGLALALFRHGPTRTVVASLGVHGAGRVLYCGLDGWERMNEWNAEPFNRWVTRMVMDLLTPLGSWKTGQPGLGVYPLTGEPGRQSLLVARAAAPTDAAMELRFKGPGEQIAPVALAGSNGWFQTARSFAQEGDYALSAAGVDRVYEVRRAVSSETRDLSLREDFLRELAAAAGGTYTALADLPEVLKTITERTRESIETRTIRTLDFRLWILVLFLVLATADFAVRKQIGLVM